MPQFRIYTLDITGNITDLELIQAPDDKGAISAAQTFIRVGNDRMELWRGTRFVKAVREAHGKSKSTLTWFYSVISNGH